LEEPFSSLVEHIPCDVEFLVERAHRRNSRFIDVGNETRQ